MSFFSPLSVYVCLCTSISELLLALPNILLLLLLLLSPTSPGTLRLTHFPLGSSLNSRRKLMMGVEQLTRHDSSKVESLHRVGRSNLAG